MRATNTLKSPFDIPHILTHITNNFQNGHQVIFQFRFGGSVEQFGRICEKKTTTQKNPKVFDREESRIFFFFFCIVTNTKTIANNQEIKHSN